MMSAVRCSPRSHAGGEFLPELQSHQLVAVYPELRDHVIDPVTGFSIAEMRAKVQGTEP